jgi:hypothetical protein
LDYGLDDAGVQIPSIQLLPLQVLDQALLDCYRIIRDVTIFRMQADWVEANQGQNAPYQLV